MEIWLIRHGEMAGDPHAHYYPPVSGCLSDRGCEQAASLAKSLAKTRFDRVFSSPLGRALQTAQSIAEPAGMKIEVEPWLIEWKPATVTGECDETQYEQICRSVENYRVERCWKTPAGEGTLELAHRVIVGIHGLLARFAIEPGHGGYLVPESMIGQRMALVAHGGSLGRLAAFFLNIPVTPAPSVAFEQTGLAVFKFMRRADVWYPVLQMLPPYQFDCIHQ